MARLRHMTTGSVPLGLATSSRDSSKAIARWARLRTALGGAKAARNESAARMAPTREMMVTVGSVVPLPAATEATADRKIDAPNRSEPRPAKATRTRASP